MTELIVLTATRAYLEAQGGVFDGVDYTSRQLNRQPPFTEYFQFGSPRKDWNWDMPPSEDPSFRVSLEDRTDIGHIQVHRRETSRTLYLESVEDFEYFMHLRRTIPGSEHLFFEQYAPWRYRVAV